MPMPMQDRIRARVREKDCFLALFPDDGFSVLSPLNAKLYPIPASNTTGCRDIDDGLGTLNYNLPATGNAFNFISGNYGSRFYLKANIAGQTPHHTIMMRAFITDNTSAEAYPYGYRLLFGFFGGTSYLDHANFTCNIEINAQKNMFFYGIQSYACFQNSEEYAVGGSSANRSAGKIQKSYDRSALSGRWLNVAATVDQTSKTHRLYFNGELVASQIRSSWTDDRNMFSQRTDYNACSLGHSYANKEFSGITSKVAWAAVFSSVLSANEIKYLSEE